MTTVGLLASIGILVTDGQVVYSKLMKHRLEQSPYDEAGVIGL